VRDGGDRLLCPDGAAQQTSTGPTATCGVSVSSSSCAPFLSTSCQVCEDGGERRGRPTTTTKVTAQQTSTGPTTTCGVSVGSRGCATSLSISCQVREDGGKRRGRPTTTSRRRSSTNEYGTNHHGWSLPKFKQLRNFSFDILPSSWGRW
jgi:hypothetical protein